MKTPVIPLVLNCPNQPQYAKWCFPSVCSYQLGHRWVPTQGPRLSANGALLHTAPLVKDNIRLYEEKNIASLRHVLQLQCCVFCSLLCADFLLGSLSGICYRKPLRSVAPGSFHFLILFNILLRSYYVKIQAILQMLLDVLLKSCGQTPGGTD